MPPPQAYVPPPQAYVPPPPPAYAPPPQAYVPPPPAYGVPPVPPVNHSTPFDFPIHVPADRPDPVYSQPLPAGETFTIEVDGVFSCWGDHRDGVDGMYCYLPGRCPSPEVWGQLLIDDRPISEIAKAEGQLPPYQANHSYRVTVVGTGRPLKLQIADARDGSWGDNHGGLIVYTRRGASALSSEIVRVPSDRPEPVYTRGPLPAGAAYEIQAWGVFSCWGDHTDGVDPLYCYAPWRCPTPEVWGQLLIDDVPLSDVIKSGGGAIVYQPNHTYSVMIRGTGRPLKLQIADAKGGSWSDNHGALEVRIFRR